MGTGHLDEALLIKHPQGKPQGMKRLANQCIVKLNETFNIEIFMIPDFL